MRTARTTAALVLVAVFVPVAFMTGYARRFIYPFGFTMAFAVMVSLLRSVGATVEGEGTPTLPLRSIPDAIDEAKISGKLKQMAFDKWPDSIDAIDSTRSG